MRENRGGKKGLRKFTWNVAYVANQRETWSQLETAGYFSPLFK